MLPASLFSLGAVDGQRLGAYLDLGFGGHFTWICEYGALTNWSEAALQQIRPICHFSCSKEPDEHIADFVPNASCA